MSETDQITELLMQVHELQALCIRAADALEKADVRLHWQLILELRKAAQ